ncbi:hypothetical protein Efla_007085 [Eimeria flavescens]
MSSLLSPHSQAQALHARLCSVSALQQRLSTSNRASRRILRALDLMRKAANEVTASRASGTAVPVDGGSEKSGRSASRRGAVEGSRSLLHAMEESEDEDEDDEDDEDEDLDDLEDDDDDEAGDADEEYDPIAPRGPLENNNYGEVWLPVQARPRRNRKSHAVRRLVQESVVRPSSLIYPLFVHDKESSVPVPSMPGQRRLSPSDVLKEIDEARRYGVNAFMLFPKVDDNLKSPLAEESYNPDGLMPRIIMSIKDAFPDALVMADVALDPYSSVGQDGVVDEETGSVLNDMTVYQICKQAVNLARAGADMVCPSEMMDGRVTAIREALDMEGCVDTSILSYACKYASSLYGPFRDALGSHVKRGGDKKTYQMDFSNAREAEREAELDVQEGADMLMVKPGMSYLDILRRVRQKTSLPLAAYQVSGEYSMIKSAAEKGWIDEKAVVLETLKGFRRAGADAVATYYAKDVAKWMAEDCGSGRSFTEPSPRCRPPLPVPPPGGGSGWQASIEMHTGKRGERGPHQLFAAASAESEQSKYPVGGSSHMKDLKAFCALAATPLPAHPYLQRRVLSSGLEVCMLPHAHPEGSLEVHLEIHAGSTAEEETERGMAHLCEHLIFMGNRKRGDVVALQGEANAFTDFHHTVYFVSWKVGDSSEDPDGGMGRRLKKGKGAAGASTVRKLNTALEMMREVFMAPTQFTAERLLKEKAAVISESSLVNTIFYRREQAQLSKLHSDTLLPSRFPIGDMDLLRRWSIEEVRSFFSRFYRPENASLYIVGDVAPTVALRAADEVLGAIQGDATTEAKWRFVSENWRQSTVKKQSISFPPLTHAWTRDGDGKEQTLPKLEGENDATSKTTKTNADVAHLKKLLGCRLHLWQHSLLQHFSLLFLRKLPITPMRTVVDFCRVLARKLILQALSLRLIERCRSADGGWMRVEVADTESIKEGCRIVSVEAEAEQSCWSEAVRVAVEEVRQMATYGLSEHELSSLLDSYRVNLDRMHVRLLSSADMLRLLMEGSACEHSVVHLEDERSLALQLARGEFFDPPILGASMQTPGELEKAKDHNVQRLLRFVNKEAHDLFSWLEARNAWNGGDGPDAICAFLVPSGRTAIGSISNDKRSLSTQLQGHLEVEDEDLVLGEPKAHTSSTAAEKKSEKQEQAEAFTIPKDSILTELCAALTCNVPFRHKGVETPKQLLTQERLRMLETRAAHSFAASGGLVDAGFGVKTLQLANGVKVNIKALEEERRTALIRVLIPGGRLASVNKELGSSEDSRSEKLRTLSAAMVLGARTMMEGGALGPFSREQIEAFCQGRLIGVSIECLDEFLVIDISTPAFAARDSMPRAKTHYGNASTLENAMQLLHLIFTAFNFEESAFRRAKQQTFMDYHAYSRDLVGYSLGELIVNMTQRDPRFDALRPALIEGLELPFVERQVRSQIAQRLATGSVEQTVEHLTSGSNPSNANAKITGFYPASDTWTKVHGRRVDAYVRDSESRAVVHIAGYACNRWGRNPDGSLLWQLMDALDENSGRESRLKNRLRGNKHPSAFSSGLDHRRHRAFPRVALWILQELITKRLFSVLREEKRLTYEAAFEVMSFDILSGGVFIITVHTQPEQVERVLEATYTALQQAASTRPLLQSQLEGAKQQVISRHVHDRKYGRYWLDLLGGLQLSELPAKSSSYFEDFERVVESVTLKDIHSLLRSLGIYREKMWEAIGISGPVPPAEVSRVPSNIREAPIDERSSTSLDAKQQSVL